MATIKLEDVLFYRNGKSGVSRIVGNDTGTSEGRRVARYTFTVPELGAAKSNVTFHIGGLDDGKAIPLRFYIGTDPESHAMAGAESPYTGDLTLAEDWLSFTGEASAILIPGKTYYLWVFPASDTYGYYSWGRSGYTSTIETSGASAVIPVVRGGRWYGILNCVVRNGKWFLIAPCVVRGGKWYYIGGPI